MKQIYEDTHPAHIVMGEEDRALQHLQWFETVGAKRYGPACHSRLQVRLFHNGVLSKERVNDLSMYLVERRLGVVVTSNARVSFIIEI